MEDPLTPEDRALLRAIHPRHGMIRDDDEVEMERLREELR
jgi:hypothetical protein